MLVASGVWAPSDRSAWLRLCLQNQLYVHSGNGCGQTNFSLPLGFGSISVNGVPCPASSGALTIGFDLTLPTAAPAGNYAVQFTGTDQSSASLWCVDTKFTF